MVVLTCIFILYFLLIAIFLVGWKRAMQEKTDPLPSKDPLISVVIPVRNEEMTIGNLLTDLSQQEYKSFEIIVVNDDSEDETLWMVSRFKMKNLRVLHNNGKGKKAAISTGIRSAKGSIVVTTDADCSVSPQWLTHIREQFRNPRTMMAFGGVRMEGSSSFFDCLQAMEFSSLIGSGASTAALGVPTLCNGANLAFRKKAFTEVKGYDDNINIPSGDDEFFMRKIQKCHPGSIHFMNSPETVVATRSQPTPQ
ncbi:MAG: glycosyltransferase, partial [Cyclobacteriaceae bacterium]